MGKDVIIALDFDSREKTMAFLDRFAGEGTEKPFVKILWPRALISRTMAGPSA